MTMSTAVKLLILLAVVVILFPFMTRIFDWIYGQTPDQVCTLSVIKHATSKEASVTGVQGSVIKCPRKQIIFYNDKVEIDGDKVRVRENQDDGKSSNFDALNSYIVNQVMADELVSCFSKMGKGDLNVFNQEFFFMDTENTLNVDRVPCMICSEVNFHGFDILFTSSGLEDYLISTDYKENLKYYDFLAQKTYLLDRLHPFTKTKTYKSFGQETVFDLRTDKSYAVVFLGGKTTKVREKIFGESNFYSVNIMESEKIAERCSFIYN